MPPASGMAAPSSAKATAPKKLKMPPTTQTASMRTGAGTATAISEGDRKIPEPMIPPMTIMMTSQRLRTRGKAIFVLSTVGQAWMFSSMFTPWQGLRNGPRANANR